MGPPSFAPLRSIELGLAAAESRAVTDIPNPVSSLVNTSS